MAFEERFKKEILNLSKKDWNLEVLECDQKKELSEGNLQKINYSLASTDFVISFLKPYGQKVSLLEKLKNPKIVIKRDQIDSFEEGKYLKELVESVIEVEKEITILAKEKKDEQEKLKKLEQFGDLSFVPRETENIDSLIIKTDNQRAELYADFFHLNKISHRRIAEYQAKTYFETIFLKEKLETLKEFLKENFGEVVNYELETIPKKERELALEKIKKIERKELIIQRDLVLKADNLHDLKIYHDLLFLKRKEVILENNTLNSTFLNYVTFWATPEEKDRFAKELKTIGEVKIIEASLKEDELPPVYLENNKTVSPFQAVTDIFGLPSASELDPTPYLAVFFIVYFGICITDAGYGLILALFTGLLLLFFKKSFGKSNLLKLLFYAGISTFIMGILFGSYFGVSPAEIGLPFMGKLKVIDPIKDTLLFMEIAFLLGFIQICFAQIVKIINSKKQKDKEGMISGATWFMFFISFGIFLLSIKFPFLAGFAKVGMLLFGIGLFWVEARGQKIFLIPIVGGIKVLQGLINTVSDVLSYSRLMALGLGTGVIALIVNQIAFLIGGMIPYVGWIVTGTILIGGHLFNLGINALGGFIHSARLQFVEFFPKFMEGGGRRLEPMGGDLKFIIIN